MPNNNIDGPSELCARRHIRTRGPGRSALATNKHCIAFRKSDPRLDSPIRCEITICAPRATAAKIAKEAAEAAGFLVCEGFQS